MEILTTVAPGSSAVDGDETGFSFGREDMLWLPGPAPAEFRTRDRAESPSLSGSPRRLPESLAVEPPMLLWPFRARTPVTISPLSPHPCVPEVSAVCALVATATSPAQAAFGRAGDLPASPAGRPSLCASALRPVEVKQPLCVNWAPSCSHFPCLHSFNPHTTL